VTARIGIAALALVVGLGCSPLPIPHGGPYHRADATVSVTRLVHASFLVEVGGARLYVDPWLYSGIVFRQTEPLGLRPHALPPADAVLLTSGDDDRFDRRALGQIAPRVPVALGPRRLADDLRDLGFHTVVALEPWEEARVAAVTVTAVPTDDPARGLGYVLSAPAARIYTAGPTRLFSGLEQIATSFPDIDVALLPIGGPRFFGLQRQMGPAEAAQAVRMLDPRRVVPIAYGRTGGQPLYWYAGRPVERFREATRAAGASDDRVVVLATGESWHLYATP
jgi:L-ascorbate metabolism protein UlaG (beta-lactamase superfamily)